LALPREAHELNSINRLAGSLGEIELIELQRISGTLPKPSKRRCSTPKAEVVRSNVAERASATAQGCDGKVPPAECPRNTFARRELSLYDGRERLGSIIEIGAQRWAIATDGSSLGVFPTLKAAIDALGRANGERR